MKIPITLMDAMIPNSLRSLLSVKIKVAKPDAVVISTPNEMHYEQIMYLLDNRIPIFCEKPLFWNWGDNYLTFSKKE